MEVFSVLCVSLDYVRQRLYFAACQYPQSRGELANSRLNYISSYKIVYVAKVAKANESQMEIENKSSLKMNNKK